MKIAQRQLLIAALVLLFGGNAFAADPPKEEAKKDEAPKQEAKVEGKKTKGKVKK